MSIPEEKTKATLGERVTLLEYRMTETQEDVKSMRQEFTSKLDSLAAHIADNSVGAFLKTNWKSVAVVILVMSGQSLTEVAKVFGLGG